MKTYAFTLVLKGVDENTPDLEDHLYDANCHDALINFRNGTVYLDFDRESTSLDKAIISAIKDVESSNLDISVTSVAPDNWVNEVEIAKRTNTTRQTVSLWVKGERRAAFPFPGPELKLTEKSPLWRWSEVVNWLFSNKIITDESTIDEAIFIEIINDILLGKHHTYDNHLYHELLQELDIKNNRFSNIFSAKRV